MIRLDPALREARSGARMLLQAHDELIFEAAEKNADKTIETAVKVMEGACAPALQLSVPLKVDAKAAENWEAAH